MDVCICTYQGIDVLVLMEYMYAPSSVRPSLNCYHLSATQFLALLNYFLKVWQECGQVRNGNVWDFGCALANYRSDIYGLKRHLPLIIKLQRWIVSCTSTECVHIAHGRLVFPRHDGRKAEKLGFFFLLPSISNRPSQS